MRKTIIGLAALSALILPFAIAPAAQAAIGDEIIVNGDFENVAPDGSLVGATTDFALAALGVQGFEYADPGDPLMSWDEGTAVVRQPVLPAHPVGGPAERQPPVHRQRLRGRPPDRPVAVPTPASSATWAIRCSTTSSQVANICRSTSTTTEARTSPCGSTTRRSPLLT